jgi:hypothetical protein
MTDIVERLRTGPIWSNLMIEAADEIERLRAEIRQLLPLLNQEMSKTAERRMDCHNAGSENA